MYDVNEFVRWALERAKKESIPSGALIPLDLCRCGAQPWQYLFGSVRVRTTDAALDRYFENRYKKQMTRARFDSITKNWDRNGFATDCQGLLDAFLTYEKDERTDINADMNYRLWCSEKGRIAEISRPFKVGEAVFREGSGGRMDHVGWICGFIGGEPLVIEARGIAYGVVVTRLSERDFTHRGLMSQKFDYPEGGARFEVTSPMQRGECFMRMQAALNAANYADYEDKPLEEDGKWGRRSQSAFDKLVKAHTD